MYVPDSSLCIMTRRCRLAFMQGYRRDVGMWQWDSRFRKAVNINDDLFCFSRGSRAFFSLYTPSVSLLVRRSNQRFNRPPQKNPRATNARYLSDGCIPGCHRNCHLRGRSMRGMSAGTNHPRSDSAKPGRLAPISRPTLGGLGQSLQSNLPQLLVALFPLLGFVQPP
jgi:hypothetical protein